MSIRQRKNVSLPWGSEPQIFRFSALILCHWVKVKNSSQNILLANCWLTVNGWPAVSWQMANSRPTVGQWSAKNWLVKQGWNNYYGHVMFHYLRQWSTSLLCLWSVSKTPSTLKSDSHLISLYNIVPESNIKLMRIEEMITNSGTS